MASLMPNDPLGRVLQPFRTGMFLGIADFSYEIESGRRAPRASRSQFHSRIKQCLFL